MKPSSYEVVRLTREEIKLQMPRLCEIARSRGVYWSRKKGYKPSEAFASGILFVVKHGDMIVGYGGLMAVMGHWCLRNCVVHPDHRGHGIQRKLIQARIQYVRSKFGKSLSAWVLDSNLASLVNLKHMGFQLRTDKPRLYGNRLHIGLKFPSLSSQTRT